MSVVAVAIGGSALVGAYSASKSAKAGERAANTAADAQVQAAQLGIDEQQRQFDAIQALLNPYVQAGTGALGQQQDLLGSNGWGSQQSAIDSLKASPQFQSLLQQGESSILSNASATGGLRGGNTQSALAQFSPQLLAQTIEAQYGRLGGLSSMGQNAAAGVGNAGMQTGNSIAALLQQQGAAQAGGALGGANAYAQGLNGMSGAFGSAASLLANKNWGGFGGTAAPVGITGGNVSFGAGSGAAAGGFGQSVLL